jgi:hypothetical protein
VVPDFRYNQVSGVRIQKTDNLGIKELRNSGIDE